MRRRLPKLPQLLDRKLYKTGQTRGADDDVIYQNRVSRASTVLIPFQLWTPQFAFPEGDTGFENGFIVLISPSDYFENARMAETMSELGLELGQNSLVFYETRADWDRHGPDNEGWHPATSRRRPLGGQYAARVPGTTATKGRGRITHGFNSTSAKGAGIRLYEYASKRTIERCRCQLEALYWLSSESIPVVVNYGMAEEQARVRKNAILEEAEQLGLLDYDRLQMLRIIDGSRTTMCPLCLLPITPASYFERVPQAEGREVPDLTVTETGLFHLMELRYGAYNHRPYNLAWGHHHCNVVARDSGIGTTLLWMKGVIERNEGRNRLS